MPFNPSYLNTLRLPTPAHYLVSSFNVVLSGTAPLSPQLVSCPDFIQDLVTPADVQGPFYVPSDVENPARFPPRSTACVPDPVCLGDNGCSTSSYFSGLPFTLTGTVIGSDGSECWLVEGAQVDLWSADPSGQYWSVDDWWRRLEEEEHSKHYNCRAHGLSTSTGAYSFSTLIPGHYVAGSDWRPRHLHMKVAAEGLGPVVTQVYFEGDPLLGELDTACGACKSDHPDLVVAMTMYGGEEEGGVDFELGMLEGIGVVEGEGGGTAAPTDAPTAEPTAEVTAEVTAEEPGEEEPVVEEPVVEEPVVEEPVDEEPVDEEPVEEEPVEEEPVEEEPVDEEPVDEEEATLNFPASSAKHTAIASSAFALLFAAAFAH